MAELAEGAPLLREYGVDSSIEGSNPSLSAIRRRNARLELAGIINLRLINAPVAQLDRVPGYEPGGREFESLRARHLQVIALSHLIYLGVSYAP